MNDLEKVLIEVDFWTLDFLKRELFQGFHNSFLCTKSIAKAKIIIFLDDDDTTNIY